MMVIGMDFTVVASRGYRLNGLRNSVLGSTEETRALVNALKQDPNYEDAFYKIGYFIIRAMILQTPLSASISCALGKRSTDL